MEEAVLDIIESGNNLQTLEAQNGQLLSSAQRERER